MHDVIVVGGGPAGMTAALYALRNGKSALVIEKAGFGGQITHSPKVENYPGTLSPSGNEIADGMFDQIMVEHYFTDTPWKRTLQKFVKTYDTRRRAMLAALDEYMPPEVSWTHPEGGFFVWVTLPEYVDAVSMLAEAMEHGVIYTPGDGFYPDGKRGRNCMRIAFSYEDPENLEEAIRRLAEVIEDRLELYRVFMEAGALPAAEEE